jgi:hypothetical protein
MENSNSENRVLETETNNEIKNPINHEINPILNNLFVKIEQNHGDDSLLDLQEPLNDEYPEYLKSKLISNKDEDFANELKLRLDSLTVQVFQEPPEEFEESMSEKSSCQRLHQIKEDVESIIEDSKINENSEEIKKINIIKNKIQESIHKENIQETKEENDLKNENEKSTTTNIIFKNKNDDKNITDEKNESVNQTIKTKLKENSTDEQISKNLENSINNEIPTDSLMTHEENKEPVNKPQDYYYVSDDGSSLEETDLETDSYIDKKRPQTVSNTFEKYKMNVENNNYAKLTMRRLKTAKERITPIRPIDIVKEETIILNQQTPVNNTKPEILRNENDFKLHFAEVSVIDAKRKLNQIKNLKSLETLNDSSEYVEIDLLNDTNDDYNELEILKNNQNKLPSKKKPTIRIALPKISGKESNKKVPLISKISTPTVFKSASESKIPSKRKTVKKPNTTSNDLRNVYFSLKLINSI